MLVLRMALLLSRLQKKLSVVINYLIGHISLELLSYVA